MGCIWMNGVWPSHHHEWVERINGYTRSIDWFPWWSPTMGFEAKWCWCTVLSRIFHDISHFGTHLSERPRCRTGAQTPVGAPAVCLDRLGSYQLGHRVLAFGSTAHPFRWEKYRQLCLAMNINTLPPGTTCQGRQLHHWKGEKAAFILHEIRKGTIVAMVFQAADFFPRT